MIGARTRRARKPPRVVLDTNVVVSALVFGKGSITQLYTLVIHVPEPPPAVPACRDPFDLPFLHMATAGKADDLVTGDADLLVLAGKVRFQIMRPEALLLALAP